MPSHLSNVVGAFNHRARCQSYPSTYSNNRYRSHLLRQWAARAANAFPWVCNFHRCNAERTLSRSYLASAAAA